MVPEIQLYDINNLTVLDLRRNAIKPHLICHLQDLEGFACSKYVGGAKYCLYGPFCSSAAQASHSSFPDVKSALASLIKRDDRIAATAIA